MMIYLVYMAYFVTQYEYMRLGKGKVETETQSSRP